MQFNKKKNPCHNTCIRPLGCILPCCHHGHKRYLVRSPLAGYESRWSTSVLGEYIKFPVTIGIDSQGIWKWYMIYIRGCLEFNIRHCVHTLCWFKWQYNNVHTCISVIVKLRFCVDDLRNMINTACVVSKYVCACACTCVCGGGGISLTDLDQTFRQITHTNLTQTIIIIIILTPSGPCSRFALLYQTPGREQIYVLTFLPRLWFDAIGSRTRYSGFRFPLLTLC